MQRTAAASRADAAAGPQRTGAPGPTEKIGEPGKDVVALAFGAGALDTVMHLGVVHALLVSEGRHPDVVAGISTGAVNAAALAEILQADGPVAQVARFRDFLETYQQSPGLLLNALLPDTYEVKFQRPLAPVELPIYTDREREQRAQSSRERAGLINLLNDLLALHLDVRLITQAVRHGLGYVEAGDRRWLACWRERLSSIAGLWWLAAKHPVKIAPLPYAVLSSRLHQWSKAIREWASRGGYPFPSPDGSGASAGQILLGSHLRRRLGRLVSAARRFALSLLLFWFAVPAAALGLPALTVLLLARALPRAATHWPAAVLDGAGLLLVAALGGAAVLAGFWILCSGVSEALLDRYSLLDSLANAYPLRQLLIQAFDPDYYGPADLEKVVAAALGDSPRPMPIDRSQRKLLRAYFRSSPQILVAPVAADVATGELTALPQDVPVVWALLAATAVVPIFRAEQKMATAAPEARDPESDDHYYIDGSNVANEPTSVLMDILREWVLPEARGVRVYAVSLLPLANAEALSDASCHYPGLVAVVRRVLKLQKLRDATLERRLTELYTRLLPEGRAIHQETRSGKRFVRADLYSIEPDRPLELSEKFAKTEEPEARRALIYEGVAAGCRAALEAMIQPAIAGAGAGPRSCWRSVATHLGREPNLLGSNPKLGPGLAEVCRACALNRGPEPERQGLRSFPERTGWAWPRSQAAAAAVAEGPTPMPPCPPSPAVDPASGGPQIALLFSGGVFRGVFQAGVLAGLHQVGLQPKVFAGASVGAITAAMAARLFGCPPDARNRKVGDLAATFLSLDRLVLTDRFADFVRRFTLRAGDTKFTISDADLLLRRYDHGSEEQFSGTVRRLVAGLERLVYVTPFEVLQLVREFRSHHNWRGLELLGEQLQKFLDRLEVGQEVLGCEPLIFLITHHVLRRGPDERADPNETFAEFEKSTAATLLAVTTNLTRGRLDTLPSSQEDGPAGALLLQALLASSAFPGVFRPRWSWEVYPGTSDVCQYIDGGVMDNLPLDAVVKYLDGGKCFARRPQVGATKVPHLLFTASLEPRTRHLSQREADKVAKRWPALRRRAGQLRYNRKIDGFRSAQQDFRAIYTDREERGDRPRWEPIDIEVVTVKPEWLCSTFGFHPMLGFRRRKQAQSIAHGCAMTMATLYSLGAFGVESQRNRDWLTAWGVKDLFGETGHAAAERAIEPSSVQLDPGPLSEQERLDPALIRDRAKMRLRLNPAPEKTVGGQKQQRKPGECWFRRGALCPFYLEEPKRGTTVQAPDQATIDRRLTLVQELRRIHDECGKGSTHAPRRTGPA